MEFYINGLEWVIKTDSQENIIEDYRIGNRLKKEDVEKYSCINGLTKTVKSEVVLREDLNKQITERVLKHELMHVYLYSTGVHNFSNFDEEDVCNFSAAAHDFIDDIVKKYMKFRYEIGSANECKSEHK